MNFGFEAGVDILHIVKPYAIGLSPPLFEADDCNAGHNNNGIVEQACVCTYSAVTVLRGAKNCKCKAVPNECNYSHHNSKSAKVENAWLEGFPCDEGAPKADKSIRGNGTCR